MLAYRAVKHYLQSEQLLTVKKRSSMATDVEKLAYLAMESHIFKY